MPGVLFNALLAAALITLVACPIILAIYRNTIRKIITLKASQAPHSSSAVALVQSDPTAENLQSPALLLAARTRLERLAAVYSAAGIACAGLLTLAFLLEASARSYTAPFVFLTIFSWPIVLCLNQIAGWDSRVRRRRYLLYAAILTSLWLVEMVLNPGGNPRDVPYAFLLVNIVPTFLIFCFASPAIRTIGPCIFSFSLIFVFGAWSTVHWITKSRSAVLLLSKWTAALGTSPQGAVTLFVTLSFAVFLPVGFAWMALQIRGYAQNRFSEQSIRLDSVWLTVALVQGVVVCTSTPASTGRGVCFAVLAFPAYWLVRTVGLRWARDRQRQECDSRVSLLYLRRFALRDRSERLFQAITLWWRPIGDVVLIGGPDLARSTIQPHSLVQFLLRRTKRNLIASEDAMEKQIARLPAALDLDVRSRITDFLCTDHMWRKTVKALMGRTDKVLADFRGLLAHNEGALYEIRLMVRRVPIESDCDSYRRIEIKEPYRASSLRFMDWFNTMFTELPTAARRTDDSRAGRFGPATIQSSKPFVFVADRIRSIETGKRRIARLTNRTRKKEWLMTDRWLSEIAVLFLTLPVSALAQNGSWQQYNGPVFSFNYPNTWRVASQADRDVAVADSANPISVEFAVSPGEATDPHKMTLNAQKHVMQFALANNFISKFESVNEIPGGGIRLTSHLCSIESGNLHFCTAGDPKAIDVFTIIQDAGHRVLLVETMHKPGIDEKEINLARQIVETMRLAQ